MIHASTRIAAVSFVIASVAVFAGCEDKAGGAGSASAAKSSAASGAAAAGGKVASCNGIKAESICREWGSKNVEAAGEEHLKTMCKDLGEFKMEACPKDKRVGSCSNPEGSRIFYSEGGTPFDAAGAEKACKNGPPSEWKAGG